MDFQFSQYLGQTLVKCSMEHQAIAHWLNIEVDNNIAMIKQLLQQIYPLQHHQFAQELSIEGKEYSLYIDKDKVICQANSLAFNHEQALLEQDFSYYDAEAMASCGLEDFINLLHSYLEFHQ